MCYKNLISIQITEEIVAYYTRSQNPDLSPLAWSNPQDYGYSISGDTAKKDCMTFQLTKVKKASKINQTATAFLFMNFDQGSNTSAATNFPELELHSNTWVKGHVLSNSFGFNGDNDNIVALTTAANGRHNDQVEEPIKELLDKLNNDTRWKEGKLYCVKYQVKISKETAGKWLENKKIKEKCFADNKDLIIKKLTNNKIPAYLECTIELYQLQLSGALGLLNKTNFPEILKNFITNRTPYAIPGGSKEKLEVNLTQTKIDELINKKIINKTGIENQPILTKPVKIYNFENEEEVLIYCNFTELQNLSKKRKLALG